MRALVLLIVLLSAPALFGQKTVEVVEKGKLEELARFETVFIRTDDAAAREIIVKALAADGRLSIVEKEQDAQIIINHSAPKEAGPTVPGQIRVLIRVGLDSPEKTTRRMVWTNESKTDGPDSDLAGSIGKFLKDLDKVKKQKKSRTVRDDPYRIYVN